MGKCKICGKDAECFCPDCLKFINKLDFNSLNSERQWVEGLFMKRYNNFLVVFSLIVTAGFANNFHLWRWFIFYFGAMCLLVYWHTGIMRAYHKYDTLLKILLSRKELNEKSNPLYLIEQLQQRRTGFYGGLRQKMMPTSIWMAVIIPWGCIIFLLVTGMLINCCVIK